MASALPPVRGVAFSFEISLISQADTDTFQDNPTLAAGDVKIIKDGTLDGNIDTLPTAVTSLTRVLTVPLSVDEMTADRVTVLFHDAAGNEWQDAVVTIYTAARTIDDLATPTNITGGTINSVSGTVSANVVEIDSDTAPVDNLVLALGNSSGVMISNAAVDAVWDEVIAGHLTAGTTGAKLNTASSASGSGSTAYTNTVTDDSSNPLDGVEVWITSDSGGASTVASTTTSTLGTFTVYLDPGTYYLWLAKGGYNFPNPTTITVS